ncbi:MAG: 50S ribosomal protein L15 [Alphaproteobacteria bacterium]
MTLTLTNLPKIKRNSKIRVGRGIGSSKGKTSGRGVKGQKARTGHHSVKGFEGGQTPVHMRLPKKGFVNNLRQEIEAVNYRDIENLIKNKKIDAKSEVNKDVLFNLGLVKSKKSIVKLIVNKIDHELKIKVVVDKYSKNAQKYS